MFVIQPINRLYKENKYVGIRESGLPYPIYETSKGYPSAIHDFESKEAAESFLIKFVNHENIDISELSASQMVDIALVNNANKFQILKCKIENNKLVVEETYQLPQFSRKDWY